MATERTPLSVMSFTANGSQPADRICSAPSAGGVAVVHNGGDAPGLDAVALRDVARVGNRAEVFHVDSLDRQSCN